jgi:hypothetical protein
MIEKIPARVGMRAGARLATYEPAAATDSEQKHLDAHPPAGRPAAGGPAHHQQNGGR